MNTDVIHLAPAAPDTKVSPREDDLAEDDLTENELTAADLTVEDLTTEDLIEEVSIDGMCGVY
jgi:mycofactocin precursor